MPYRLTLFWYAATVFISSAILLVIEITAARLIAPYVGVTLYSWTSIIGVILAGLSLGNWLGGVWADRGADKFTVGVVLFLAGVFSLLSLLVLSWLAPMLQHSNLDLISASFLYTLAMFFLPSVLLGVPAPLLTTMALRLDERIGHIVGRMHALAALGSIFGTFITGFVLIQYLGSRFIMIMSSLILVALALPFFRRTNRLALMGLLLMAFVVTAGSVVSNGFENPCDRESGYFCIRVVDMSDQAPFGNARGLVLDHLVHGINHESEPGLLLSPYIHLMDELILAHFNEQEVKKLRYYFAGGGAYTQPRAVAGSYPDAEVVVAELDPLVTETVKKQLYLDDESIRIIHGDARAVLQSLGDQYFDVIITDAFHDIAIPYHLVTLEFIRLVRQRLSNRGMFVTNVVDAFPDPRMVKSLTNTLKEVFDAVDIWVHEIPGEPQRMTYVISASNKAHHENLIRASRGLNRHWFRINEPLENSGTRMADLPVFTDDYVPVERMISSLLFTAQGL